MTSEYLLPTSSTLTKQRCCTAESMEAICHFASYGLAVGHSENSENNAFGALADHLRR